MVRELRWLFVLPQVVASAIAVATAIILSRDVSFGLIAGLSVYLAYSFGSRAILGRHHKTGIRLVRARDWKPALLRFRQSQGFFERHPWIDRYRQVVMMSPSGASYHEMALVNQGVCLLHLGRGAEARALYNHALNLYPDSPLAEAALVALNSESAA